MRDNPARVLVPALVALALVGVVAIAATGSTPGGSSDASAPGGSFFDIVLTIVLIAFIPAAIIYVYGLLHYPRGKTKRQPLKSYLSFAIFMVLFTLVVYYRLRDWNTTEFAEDEVGEPGFTGEAPVTPDERAGSSTYQPEFVWGVPLALGALVALAIAAWYLAERREKRRASAEAEALAEAVAVVLDDTLDDLRAEKDPRKAVIAAYARLERVLGAHALGRRPEETPQEYLNRILPRLELERGSVRRLTDLFTRAKFSPHAVDARMKDEAIEALSTVRDELRAAAERRHAAELARLEAAEEA